MFSSALQDLLVLFMEDVADDHHLRCNDNINDVERLSLDFMTGKPTSTAEIQSPVPPPFLVKTYKVVEDPITDEVISWNGDGTGFVVWQPAEFARDLLPTLFKHCNFSSFVRQLNTYGFRKVTTTRWEFSNGMFRKGQRELMCNIRRRKSWSHSHSHNKSHQVVPTTTTVKQEDHQRLGIDHHNEDQRSSSTSSSFVYSALLDENKCLKNENEFLSSELGKTKKTCKQLMELVERYREEDETDDDDNNEEDEGLKLFGVKLE